MWVCPKVMETLEKVAIPSAFALKSQYIPAIKAARDAAGAADEEAKIDAPGGAKDSEKRKHDGSKKTGWNYANVRSDYIKKLQKDGMNYKQAVDDWNKSECKRSFLQDVSVKELKRRKFIPKGSSTNPWAEKDS